VLQLGLQRLPKDRAGKLHAALLAFEKQHGSVAGIEDAITARRRAAYEELVAANPLNYDAWFDYVRLEESEAAAGAAAPQLERAREVFERAIACVPPAAEKRYWRRYVYLWISYAVFEELVAGDGARARAVLREALKLIPHRTFTFAKLWLMAAHAEVRALCALDAVVVVDEAYAEFAAPGQSAAALVPELENLVTGLIAHEERPEPAVWQVFQSAFVQLSASAADVARDLAAEKEKARRADA
jgi:crooked neck